MNVTRHCGQVKYEANMLRYWQVRRRRRRRRTAVASISFGKVGVGSDHINSSCPTGVSDGMLVVEAMEYIRV